MLGRHVGRPQRTLHGDPRGKTHRLGTIVQSWFNNNREPDHDHNHVNTRKELIEYDPGRAAICKEVFGDTELVYTKPATRLHGHMAGYDPSSAPTFQRPERLREAQRKIHEEAQQRGSRKKPYTK